MTDFNIGDRATLKIPVKGYSNIEIVGRTDCRLIVQTSSGMEIEIYEDELED